MKKKVRGFTLPEVLVTVTVVAVLAAVVVPAVTQYVGRGNGPATQTDISQIQNAITAYYADTRQAPHFLSDLVRNSAPSGRGIAASSFHGPYFSGIVTSGTSNTTVATTNSAFTTSGLGIVFADSIDVGSGYASLFVVDTATTCANLIALDSAIDGKTSSSFDINGKVTWTDATSCSYTTRGGTYSAAKVKVVTTGS